MAINWRLREPVFRLLAAVYAELGEEAFKGRYVPIAQFFGPDATYDAIKSFFNKEVSKAAEELVANCPGLRGSGRVLPRRGVSTQTRPPLLYFDDQDISILTQREVEAHFSRSLGAPAKRPRVVAASPTPSAAQDGPSYAPAPGLEVRGPVPIGGGHEGRAGSSHAPSVGPSTSLSSHAGPSSYETANGQVDHPAPTSEVAGRKRPYSALQNTSKNSRPHSPLPSDNDTSTLESFGYVTKQDQYRCALCLSQLPSQQDLNRHESESKVHRLNLQNPLKVAKGRDKLAQVSSVPEMGPHLSPPAPVQPHIIRDSLRGRALSTNETLSQDVRCEMGDGPAQPPIQQPPREDRDTPFDTIEVLSQRAGQAYPAERREARVEESVSEPRMPSLKDEKGKGRAASPWSLASEPNPQAGQQRDSPLLLFQPAPPYTTPSRPTTARTEIGTITPVHSTDTASRGSKCGPASGFSRSEIADIMRSTELVMQLMSCVQKEAVAAANAAAESSSTATRPIASDVTKPTHNQDPQLRAVEPKIGDTIGEGQPGVEPHSREGKGKAKRTKDTGEEVFFIVLD